MCFADDLLMFAGGDLHSIVALNQCFLKFSMASGLQENLEKSCVYFGGVKQNDRKQILQQMGYSQRESPFKYLGIPLSMKKLSLIQWQPLIAKIIAKISSWTAKKLAYVGRVQLVKPVLFGIQAYWSQLFLSPAKVVKIIDSYCRSYIFLELPQLLEEHWWHGTRFALLNLQEDSTLLTCICGIKLLLQKLVGI